MISVSNEETEVGIEIKVEVIESFYMILRVRNFLTIIMVLLILNSSQVVPIRIIVYYSKV